MAADTRGLGPRTRAILETLAERVIPSAGPDYPGAGDIALPEIIIREFSVEPLALRGLSAFLWWWELSPFTFSLSFKRFTSMTPEEQIRYMESWEKSRLFWRRMAFIGVKGLFMAVFYNQPAVWERIGFRDGECLVKHGEEGG